MAEPSSAKLVNFADALCKRGAAPGSQESRRDDEPQRTRLEIAAVIAMIFLMVVGWVAAQGLTQVQKCPQASQRVCGP